MIQILNSKGEPIVLNEKETKIADYNQKLCNSLGYEVPITTLTAISKKISEQKFYTSAPADYLPVKVGENAFTSNIVTYRSFQIADDFETGNINLGTGNSKMAMADAAIDSLTIPVKNWAKGIDFNILELQIASKAGNFDLVTSKELSRKRNFDIGIQKVAFLGLKNNTEVRGLLNQVGITSSSIIAKPISTMSAAELKTFAAKMLGEYRTNCNSSAMPTTFVVPETDYLGLAAPASSDFPIRSTLDLLLETFKIMTGNPNFKILPLAYADSTHSGLGHQRYAMLNYDETSLVMNVPVPYTNTMSASINGLTYSNAAYAQYTGVQCLRPLELLYFDY